MTTKLQMRFASVYLPRLPRLPDAYFKFIISELIAYLTHQAVQLSGSTAIQKHGNTEDYKQLHKEEMKLK